VRIAEASDKPNWLYSRGNSVLPRKLRLAWAYTAMGDAAKARTLYAEIHEAFQVAVKERPDDWDAHMALGLAAAGLALKDEAIAEGRRATELLPLTRDAFAGPEYMAYLAQLYITVGENGQAIDLLQQLMSIPAGLSMSAAMLRLDPTWDPLRADQRFDALLKQSENSTPHG
jgi:tetratricopeptide (TPR) repeat protein